MESIAKVVWQNSRDSWLQVSQPDGMIRLVNPAAERLCGVNSTELIGLPFIELLEPNSAKRWSEWLSERQRFRTSDERFGLWLRTRNGVLIPIKLRIYPSDKPNEETFDWLAIEDRREVQALAARLSNIDARLDETERIAKLGWWEWDIRRDAISASESLPKLFGQTEEPPTLNLDGFLSLVHPDDRELVRERHKAALQGEPYAVDFRRIRPDGEIKYFHSQGRVERDDSDQPVRMFGTCQDVTDRVQSLHDLRESELKYRELVETSREFIWAVDNEGCWTFVNQAVREIYGYEPSEMIGQPFRMVDPPERVPADWEKFVEVLSGKPLFNYETTNVRKDGQPITMSFNAIAKLDAKGQITGTTGTAIDITERKRQEQLLIERENWFRTIFENDPQFLMILSLDGKLLDLNHTGVRLIQATSSSDILGCPAASCLGSESHYPFQKAVTAASHGVARPWKALVQGKKGARAWLEGQIVPLRDASGQVVRLLAAAQDVTARKKADALRDGEQQVLEEIAFGRGLPPTFQALIKLLESQIPGVLACVCLLNDNRSYVYVAAHSSMPDEVIRRISSIRVGSGGPSFVETAATGQRKVVEDTAKDSSWEPWRSVADRFQLRSCWSEPIRGFSKNMLGTLTLFSLWPKSPTSEELKLLETGAYLAGIAVDRTRSEQKLRDSEARFRTLFEESPDAIFVESFAGVVLDANPAACRLNGLPRSELIGKHVSELVPIKWRDEVQRTFPQLVRGELRDLESYSWHPERGEIPISMRVGRIEYASQPALLLHVRDITDRRQAEAKARDMDTQLAHAGRLALMGELVAGISHEINQPLFAIGNFANACRTVLESQETPQPTDKLLDWTKSISDQATRAGEIIRRMRDFLRKSPQQRVETDVSEMIHEAIELISIETRSHHVRLECELPSNPVQVSMDRVQIQQVMVNILRNAIRAVSGNPLNDRWVNIAARIEDRQLKISIRDNGLGFQGHDPEMIFHPFYTTKTDGLGLGLTISRSIIEAHGGRLWGEANSDRGATFFLTMPLPSRCSGGDSQPSEPSENAPEASRNSIATRDNSDK